MSQTFTLPKSGGSQILANALRFIAALPNTREWDIEIKEHRKTRSDKQRGALFGVAYRALMEFSGLQGSQDKEDLHRFMCGEFYGWKTDALGNRKPVRTTTKDEDGRRDEISTKGAEEFYAFLQRRGAEVGCYVPDPDAMHNVRGRWADERAAA